MISTLLDLVLSREDDIVELAHKPGLYKNDHDILFFKIATKAEKFTKKKNHTHRNTITLKLILQNF